jgi:tetratricopeptide (TPR) repeat protein
MGPEEHEELSQKIIESAKKSTNEDSLEKELFIVIDEFTERFPELGRAKALHEATSFLFNNNARHFSFFPGFALMAYESLSEIPKWHDASVIAEHMTGYQIELLTNEQGSESELKKWFDLWAKSVNGWCEISVDEKSWPGWGTGILNRCEHFSTINEIQQDVYEFWDSLIETHGSFEPLEETLQRHRMELIEMAQIAARQMDYHQLFKVVFSNRVRLLSKLDTGDLVDLMNRMIELAPNPITDEEVEVELHTINASEDILQISKLSNDLATRLRVAGKIEDGIKILSSVVENEEFEIKYDVMAWSSIKLGIYLDEVGKRDEAEILFKQVADEDPSTEVNAISVYTVREASHRYASILSSSERYTESKQYSIRENTLSELSGDPFLFVRSCFNVAADCNDLGEEKEALEWFMLGMMNLRDGLGINRPNATSRADQEQLLEICRDLAVAMGIEERWAMLMNHIFTEDEGSSEN